MKNRNDIVNALAAELTGEASLKELQQLYYDEQYSIYNDLEDDELKECAVYHNLMSEDDEIE